MTESTVWQSCHTDPADNFIILLFSDAVFVGAPGFSGLLAEMTQATGETGTQAVSTIAY